jgi:hypothetical protein
VIGLIFGCFVDVAAVVYGLGVVGDAILGEGFILVYNFGCR